MKKTALLITAIAALTTTIYAQSPGVPKTTSPTSERLRQMIQAGATNRPSPPRNLTVTAGAPAQATAGLPNPTTGVSLPSQGTSSGTPTTPATVAGGPATSESTSAESIAPLTPQEIQILRSWIRQGGISASLPTLNRAAKASNATVGTSGAKPPSANGSASSAQQ
jgi:hypothetical protein